MLSVDVKISSTSLIGPAEKQNQMGRPVMGNLFFFCKSKNNSKKMLINQDKFLSVASALHHLRLQCLSLYGSLRSTETRERNAGRKQINGKERDKVALHTVKSLFSSIPEGSEKPAGKTSEKVEVVELPFSAFLPKERDTLSCEQNGRKRVCVLANYGSIKSPCWKHLTTPRYKR